MITTTGLTRIYGKGENAVTAINNLDIRIDDGELVAITGKSGSGKTTLLNILGGLDKATDKMFQSRYIQSIVSYIYRTQLFAFTDIQMMYIIILAP